MPAILHDLLVVLPGILGSELRLRGEPIWAPGPGVLDMIATLRRRLDHVSLPADIGDDDPGDGVEAVGLIPDLQVLPGLWTASIGYSRLLSFLRSRFELIEAPPDAPDRCANFLPIPYDWRLSNRLTARRVKRIVDPALARWRSQHPSFADAKVVFLCHSMGGLVARWFVEVEGGAAITRRIITLGTPHRGAMNALLQLVNGTKLAGFAADLTRFARTLPSLHQLLPEYACIETGRGLASLREVDVPVLRPEMVRDALAFHDTLNRPIEGGPDLMPFVGFHQPTPTTARFAGDTVVASETIEGEDERGDGTVPRLAATPRRVSPQDAAIRGVAEKHVALSGHQSILDDIEFALGASPVIRKAATGVQVSVRVEELIVAGDDLVIDATADDPGLQLLAIASDEWGRESGRIALRPFDGGARGTLRGLRPGAHTIRVGGTDAGSRVQAVTSAVLVVETPR